MAGRGPKSIMPANNRYLAIIEEVFFNHHRRGAQQFEFDREELREAAIRLGLKPPKNLGDVIYSARYRTGLTPKISATANKGFVWLVMPAGRGKYSFVHMKDFPIAPNPDYAETKVPEATPGIISMYAQGDEQALLAKIRYNRLIDIFTGITCYSLQNHLRTTVTEYGQIETDEVYVGVDSRGIQYVIPIQAKTGREKLGIIQIMQDVLLCSSKFPDLVPKPIGAQFLGHDVIVLFEFELIETSPRIVGEKHYRLVPPDQLSPEELMGYRLRTH
jgi:hypothetical protein